MDGQNAALKSGRIVNAMRPLLNFREISSLHAAMR